MSLRAGMLAVALFFGAIAGVPMTPQEIEEAMSFDNRAKVAHVLKEEKEDDGE